MRKLVVAFLLLTLASCSSGQATGPTTPQAAKAKAAMHDVMKVSQDGFAAMRAVRAARIAIFNGEPKVAVEMMEKAKKALDAASADESMFIADVKAMGGEKDKAAHKTTSAMAASLDWIPIDGQIALADTYVATPEKKQHIDKANEHFKKGQSKKAIEELRLGKIDVTYTRLMMSLSATKQCVVDAMRLAEEHKYYEANLALKAAEDALIVDSVGLVETVSNKSKPEEQTKKSPPSKPEKQKVK